MPTPRYLGRERRAAGADAPAHASGGFARHRPDIARLRSDQAAAGQLFAGMGQPAGDAAHGEDAGEGGRREGQRFQQQGGEELDVDVQRPVGPVLLEDGQGRRLDGHALHGLLGARDVELAGIGHLAVLYARRTGEQQVPIMGLSLVVR